MELGWRDRWSDAPWWVLSIVLGSSFAAVIIVLLTIRVDGVFHPYIGVFGIAAGVFVGGVTGPRLVRQRTQSRAAIGDLDRRQRGQAIKAASRGAVPDDPEVRAAAARLIRYRLAEMARQRPSTIPFWVILSLVSVAFAVLQKPWWWVATAILVGFLVLSLVQPQRMKRRLRALDTR